MTFYNFEMFTVEGVKSYLEQFLDLTQVRLDVLNHVAAWLRGRPRWTARFVEVYTMRRKRDIEGIMTRGEFSGENRCLMEALDRYLAAITCGDSSAGRRLSWNAGPSSAYHTVSKIGRAASEIQEEFKKALCAFAIGRQPEVFF